MSDGGRRLRQLLLSKYWEKPLVLRDFPTQREVTRCGCNKVGAGVRLMSTELKPACGGLHYSERGIVGIRRSQVKQSVTESAIFCCDAAQDDDCNILVIVVTRHRSST